MILVNVTVGSPDFAGLRQTSMKARTCVQSAMEPPPEALHATLRCGPKPQRHFAPESLVDGAFQLFRRFHLNVLPLSAPRLHSNFVIRTP